MFISHAYKSPNYDSRAGADITCIVLHATVGSFESARSWLCSPSSDVSSHYLISKQGETLQLVADEYRAWHAGVSSWQGTADVNNFSLSIELENANNGADPYPDAQLAALSNLCKILLADYHLTPEAIITHAMCALPQGRKSDPKGFPLHLFRASLTRPAAPRYTIDSPLIHSPYRSNIPTSGARAGGYDAHDVQTIANVYWTLARAVDLDPLLAYAQMWHETGGLTSFWSQRPRRNPAGIGVTGERRLGVMTQPGPDWALGPDGMWQAGCSFKTWAEYAIPAHLGRLLGYVMKPEQMNSIQLRMYQQAIAVRPLPPQILGCAPTVAGLGGTWAVPGTGYAQALVKIANALLETV